MKELTEKQKKIRASWNLERSYRCDKDPRRLEQFFVFEQGVYLLGMYESVEATKGWKLVISNEETGEIYPITPEEIFKMMKNERTTKNGG